MLWARPIILSFIAACVGCAGDFEQVFFKVVAGCLKSSQPRTSLGQPAWWQTAIGPAQRRVLYVNVWDTDDQPVTGLTRSEFEIFEDGIKQEILSFNVADEPLSIGILLDTSSSQRKHVAATLEAINSFVLASNPKNEYFLATFDKKVYLKVDLTNEKSLVDQLGISATRPGTAVYDALAFGLHKVTEAHYAKRALWLITDGQEYGSSYKYKELIQAIKHNEIQIYCFGVGNTNSYSSGGDVPGDYWLGSLFLDELAALTGGRTFLKDKPRELQQEAKTMAVQLRSQYRMEYDTTLPVGEKKWRKVKVRVHSASKQPTPKSNAKVGFYPQE